MEKAIFLDRDGIINYDEGYVTNLKEFRVLHDVYEALQAFQRKGYQLIIISNQGGISRKLYSKENVEEIHAFLLKELKERKIFVKEVYYCIHHPLSDSGKCICRKPDSLMLEKAMARFSINKKHTFFIGDKDSDMEAAKKAGIRGIQIESNTSLLSILNVVP